MDSGKLGNVKGINLSEIGDLSKVTVLDGVLIAVIVLFSIGVIIHTKLGLNFQTSKVSTASVYHEGKPFKHLKLDEDQEIALLNGRMLLEVKGRRIRVRESDCPRKICLNTGWIQYAGERIICVPYKVLIELRSADSPVLDAVVY